MIDVITIGSAVVDNVLLIEKKPQEIRPGDKVLVSKRWTYSGGGATNAAVALAKLGLKVGIITKLSRDHEADFIEKELKGYNIKLLTKRKNKSRLPTSSSSIIVSTKEKDRIIYTYKGASDDLNETDFSFRKLKKAKWVYLASLTGKSFATGKKIAEYCKEHRIPLLWNTSTYLARMGKGRLGPFLKAATILVLNKKEAQLLLESREEEPRKLLEKLQKLGPETVVITQGAKKVWALHGAYGDDEKDKNDQRDKKGNRYKMYTVSPAKTKVVDTTGAGDAFTATLLGMLLKGHDFPAALKMGVKNAQSVIKQHGAKNGLLTYHELGQRG